MGISSTKNRMSAEEHDRSPCGRVLKWTQPLWNHVSFWGRSTLNDKGEVQRMDKAEIIQIAMETCPEEFDENGEQINWHPENQGYAKIGDNT